MRKKRLNRAAEKNKQRIDDIFEHIRKRINESVSWSIDYQRPQLQVAIGDTFEYFAGDETIITIKLNEFPKAPQKPKSKKRRKR